MMDFNNYKSLSINGISLKQLYINGVQVWEEPATYKNWVPHSINADGTIYNGTGYKYGYRVRSGGAEAAAANAACTGFIPYKQGDILRLYPKWAGVNTVNAFNFADAEFNNIGQFTGTSRYGICAETNYSAQWNTIMNELKTQSGKITALDISSMGNAGNIAYVRVTVPYKHTELGSGFYVTSGNEIIITVNEELEP